MCRNNNITRDDDDDDDKGEAARAEGAAPAPAKQQTASDGGGGLLRRRDTATEDRSGSCRGRSSGDHQQQQQQQQQEQQHQRSPKEQQQQYVEPVPSAQRAAGYEEIEEVSCSRREGSSSSSRDPRHDRDEETRRMGSWKKKLDKAKRLHRPSLKDWSCDGLYRKFPPYVESIVNSPEERFKSFILSREDDGNGNGVRRSAAPPPRNLPVVLDAKYLTVDDFAQNYESKETPCIIRNICNGHDGAEWQEEPWPAVRKWPLEELKRSNGGDGGLGDRPFKCGEDDDGDAVKVKLRHFLRYLEENTDDSPLYVFDTSFDEDRRAKSILSDYTVPSYFREDLFGLVSESRRPPYRWFLVGPERSGTCVHVDPLATNAWNTLIEGKKRWVLFPPCVPKHVVKGRGLIARHEDDEAIHYFMFILPRIKKKAAALRDADDYRDFACYEFTQEAGETVFVPNGWWHAVLNLTHTVGVTQNFCSRQNFAKVWVKTRAGRKKMAWKWLCELDRRYPDLADRARALNSRDNFRMKYSPEEIQRRENEERNRRKLQKTV